MIIYFGTSVLNISVISLIITRILLQGKSVKDLSFQPKNKLSPLCFQVFAHVKIRKNENVYDKNLIDIKSHSNQTRYAFDLWLPLIFVSKFGVKFRTWQEYSFFI